MSAHKDTVTEVWSRFSTMRNCLKKYLRSKIWAVVLLNILQNLRNFLNQAGGRSEVIQVNCHRQDAAEAARYAMHMVSEYEKAWGRPLDLSGKTVLELGPGPFKAVALILVAKGASRVFGFDKYQFKIVPGSFEPRIYQAVLELLDEKEKRRALKIVDENGRPRSEWKKIIDFRNGKQLCAVMNDVLGICDWVLSRSVLEYVDNLSEVIKTCGKMMNEAGCMIHKVDLRDDGLFSEAGLDPQTFRRIPSWIYRLMISHSYRPRRWSVDMYLQAAKQVGGEHLFRVVRNFGDQKEKLFLYDMTASSVDVAQDCIAGGMLVTRRTGMT